MAASKSTPLAFHNASAGGTTVPEVTSDITGASRPSGGAYDIGAYERGAATALQAPKNLRVVAFLQNDATNEVLQAVEVEVQPAP